MDFTVLIGYVIKSRVDPCNPCLFILFFISNQFFGNCYSCIRIVTISVRTDFVSKPLTDGCSANHHFHLITNTGLFQCLNNLLHIRHGSSQQCAHAQDVSMVFLHSFHKLVTSHINTNINDFKAATLQHGSH